MEPTRIVMLLSNPFRPDPRVLKEAQSLFDSGYQITILCWDRMNEYPDHENSQGINILRVKIRSRYHAGTRQIYYLPRFWVKAFQLLKQLKPDVIHCHDLDTTLPGALYSSIYKVPWIFDAHECYPEQISPQVNRFIYSFLKRFERFMALRAKRVITVGEKLAKHFHSFGVQASVIGNYPEVEKYHDIQSSISRKLLGISEDTLVVSYIGGFTRARAIMPLIQAVDIYDNVVILLAGDGIQRTQIEKEIKSRTNIFYLGWIDIALVPAYMALSDIIYYGLYNTDGNSQYSTPNTLFNSMAAGKPILTTNVGEIAEIVKIENCGVVIPEATPEYIKMGIEQLRDRQTRQFLGENGRRSVLEKYNWEHAQKVLLGLYENFLK